MTLRLTSLYLQMTLRLTTEKSRKERSSKAFNLDSTLRNGAGKSREVTKSRAWGAQSPPSVSSDNRSRLVGPRVGRTLVAASNTPRNTTSEKRTGEN